MEGIHEKFKIGNFEQVRIVPVLLSRKQAVINIDMGQAKEMIDVAVETGVDAVKSNLHCRKDCRRYQPSYC